MGFNYALHMIYNSVIVLSESPGCLREQAFGN
jgi:hypothetical protein